MDSTNDLAVIAVSLDNISSDTLSSISTAVIGDSESLKVGEQVVAIGNALGYGQSVTTGIVSATNRTISSSDSSSTNTESTESSTYIQTDAAINPGNSGGALLNMDGELIGINTAKLSSTEIEGMGYAIPISRVQDIIESLMNETTKTKVEEGSQGTIGVSGRDISSDVAEAYQIPQGVYISNVSENSAAIDSRFGPAHEYMREMERICGRRVIDSIPKAEPIGPKHLLDVLVICPCTGNTLAKLANGITDTTVTMAAKAHLRNGGPLVLCLATNDGLAASAKNIAALLDKKNVYFVPFGQDDPAEKPTSLVADFSQVCGTVDAALRGEQLQPLLLRG